MKTINYLKLLSGTPTPYNGSSWYMSFSFGYLVENCFIQTSKNIRCRELLSLIPICRYLKGYPEVSIYSQCLTDNIIRSTGNNKSTYMLLKTKRAKAFKKNFHYLAQIEKETKAIHGKTTIIETKIINKEYIILRVPFFWYKNHLTLSLYALLLRTLLDILPNKSSLEKAIESIRYSSDVDILNKMFKNLDLKLFLNNIDEIIPRNYYIKKVLNIGEDTIYYPGKYGDFLRAYTGRGINSFINYLSHSKRGKSLDSKTNPTMLWVDKYISIEKREGDEKY